MYVHIICIESFGLGKIAKWLLQASLAALLLYSEEGKLTINNLLRKGEPAIRKLTNVLLLRLPSATVQLDSYTCIIINITVQLPRCAALALHGFQAYMKEDET